MAKFKFIAQQDSMGCGVACLNMICRFYGKKIDMQLLDKLCAPTVEGVSIFGMSNAAKQIGFTTFIGNVDIEDLDDENLPAILHWNQNHFVVLYKVKNKSKFYIADPAKGLINYDILEFENHWKSSDCSDSNTKGIAMFLEPNEQFICDSTAYSPKKRSFRFLSNYLIQYKKYFIQIIAGLILGCLLQLIFPFLTQAIVDIGIRNNDIKFIWLILLGELMIVIGRTATDFIRRWLLLHISIRINISLVSDFFIKLLKSILRLFFNNQLTARQNQMYNPLKIFSLA